jgi:hypothetical protein
MKEGDVLLTSLPQADGTVKCRPVLFLCRMPPFDDCLVCGITSQLQQVAPEIDEQITPAKPDYRTSGLKAVVDPRGLPGSSTAVEIQGTNWIDLKRSEAEIAHETEQFPALEIIINRSRAAIP